MSSNDRADATPAATRINELLSQLRSERIRTQPTLESTLAILNPVVEEIRLLIGREAAESINRFAGERIGDLAQKRQTSTMISDLLDGLGLRMKCHKTGQPAAFYAVSRSNGHPDGYFKTLVASEPQVQSSFQGLPRVEVTLRDMSRKPHRHASPESGRER